VSLFRVGVYLFVFGPVQYYFNSQTQQWLYWDGERSTYMPAPTSTAQDNQTAMAATSAGQEAVTEESKKEDEQKKSEKKVKVAKKIVKVSTPSVC